ncbi:MAG: IS1595 family transposase [Proteobacteria bacterium]|nr:IS1595 family transposase [Pseudomonadota bacterium]
MAMNPIQFQPGLPLVEFVAQYGTEARCRRALYRARWPKGFRCPACGDRRRSTFRRGAQTYYQCRACQHQTTLIAGTLFAATKLPLRTWFVAIYALTTTKTNVAALELMRQLDVCYRTAWRLKHKIMQAMADREQTRQLAGFVQVDDAYLGGEHNGGKVGRGSPNKQPFLIAVATDENLERPTFAVIEPVRTFDNAAMADWCDRRLAPDAEVFTDGLWAFRRFADAGHAHTVLETEGGRAATEACGARWVNIVLGNVKRAISGRYHAIRQAKYARRYLAEAAYRFNRRFRLRELLPRLMRAMMLCAPCPERSLRLASNFVH